MRSPSHWPLCTFLMVLSLVAFGCGGSSKGDSSKHEEAKADSPGKTDSKTDSKADATKRPSTQEVTISEFRYEPSTLTVAVGTRVTWINRDDVPHTVTSTAKPLAFKSGTLDTDDKFTHTFTTPGTYEYFCAVHPKMTAKVIVK